MDLMYTVYVHTSPSGKKYIGITCNSVARRWGSGGMGYKGGSYFWKAICKYGWDNFQHEIIAEGLAETEAKQSEKDLIIAYKTQDPMYGYNLTAGGDGTCGRIASASTRAKISAANLGHKTSASARAANSAAQMGNQKALGYKHTAAALAAMSAAQMGNDAFLGHKHTDSTRAAMSAAAKHNKNALGHKHTDSTRAAMSAAHRLLARKVECLTMDGEVIGHYFSCGDAAEKTGICKHGIYNVCSGRHKTAGKLRWRFV